jgi:hypothetical protein
MTKPVIVTRAVKGAPLTRTELDSNFSNIDNATIGVSDGTTSGTLDLNDTLNFAASGSATVAYNSSTKTVTVGASGGGNNIILWGSAGDSNAYRLRFYSNADAPVLPTDNLKLYSAGGVSGVSVSGNAIVLPAGTYIFEMPFVKLPNGDGGFRLYNKSLDERVPAVDRDGFIKFGALTMSIGGSSTLVSFPSYAKFVLTQSRQITIAKYTNGPYNGSDEISIIDPSNQEGSVLMFKFIKIA